MVELMPYSVILPIHIVLVSLHNIVHQLWILFNITFRNATVREQALPILGKALVEIVNILCTSLREESVVSQFEKTAQ